MREDSMSPDPATAAVLEGDRAASEATFLPQRDADRTSMCTKGALDPHLGSPLRQCEEPPGLPEAVHVDALGRPVLPLAVLLETYLLVHVQPMDCCSGLHKRPRDEGRQVAHRQVFFTFLRPPADS